MCIALQKWLTRSDLVELIVYERAVAALSYVANECANDLNQLCQDVRGGEGRLLKCLEKRR